MNRPRGREAVVEALVAAARQLFAERGPAAVSLRDVARHAGVNHGLIHHYIGSRDDLLRLVFRESTRQAAAVVDRASGVEEALAALRRIGGDRDEYARLLAWALLEGHDPRAFHGRSAALDAVAGIAGGSRDVRVTLAAAMVQTLGWKLFGGYALVAAGLEGEDADTVRLEAETLAAGLAARAAG